MLHVLLISFFTWFHPFYVSVTEVRHNQANKTLEVSCRIFYDDLERALAGANPGKVDILHPADKQALQRMLATYLQKHVQVKANDQVLPLQFAGYEIEEDAIWCYLEATVGDHPKRIHIRNEILFAEHKTQTNLLHVYVGGKRQSTKLDNPKHTASFAF